MTRPKPVIGPDQSMNLINLSFAGCSTCLQPSFCRSCLLWVFFHNVAFTSNTISKTNRGNWKQRTNPKPVGVSAFHSEMESRWFVIFFIIKGTEFPNTSLSGLSFEAKFWPSTFYWTGCLMSFCRRLACTRLTTSHCISGGPSFVISLWFVCGLKASVQVFAL